MLKVLELFSGTGSVGKCCKELGYDVLSIDLELPADINIDIMEWDYKQYKSGDFDIIWASPPCTFYSNLQNCWIGRPKKDGTILTKELLEEKRKESDKLVQRTLDIIEYFKPYYWFMENPQTGQLKDRDVVAGLPFYDVDYCMYSDWGYQKRTRIWTNKENFNNKLCNGNCGNIIEIPTNGALHTGYKKPIKSDTRKIHANPIGDPNKVSAVKKHKDNLGTTDYAIINGKHIAINTKELRKKYKDKIIKGERKGLTLHERYRIPPDLIYSLFLD